MTMRNADANLSIISFIQPPNFERNLCRVRLRQTMIVKEGETNHVAKFTLHSFNLITLTAPLTSTDSNDNINYNNNNNNNNGYF